MNKKYCTIVILILFNLLGACVSQKSLSETDLKIVSEKFEQTNTDCTYIVTLRKFTEGVPYEFTITSTQATCEEARVDANKTIEQMKSEIENTL